ncbi:hypothetical protein MLD38_020634 [Melastoma candidum]|uniref:Uncharacterized protein n=1 Tax=Melastoma candidum TaxID=119954 RepID=A0ACB9QDW1_9MYRT|nr:hypothetical protein MLD38_020634 [Melastoma candidum]
MCTIMREPVKEESEDFPSVPPGFESFSSFTLKRTLDVQKEDFKEENAGLNSCTTSVSTSLFISGDVKTDSDSAEAKKPSRVLRRRSGIKYNQNADCSDDELECEKTIFRKPSLPKGVVRGCPQCVYCQKVSARWHPEDAKRPILEDAPVFYPTEEEFEDTLTYIATIRPQAEKYGICRIVPPASWKPPCPLKEKPIWEKSKFVTRVQKVNKLQNRDSMRKMSLNQNQMRRKRRKCMRNDPYNGSGLGNSSSDGASGILEGETFGFEPGPDFTLDTFEKYAKEFKTQYFRPSDGTNNWESTLIHLEPSVGDIEGEYWRIVEKPTEEIEVLYGADLETGTFGSGFPKISGQVGSDLEDRYVKSGWNLNNSPKIQGSVLSFESGDISGVLVPWLYIGMCFSSFCWHVEDHHLYSLNYMHWGAPKMWYGVPGTDASKLEDAMRKHLPDLFEEQPDLLHKLVTQLSPSILKSEGVPVYRCIQQAGDFVLTFPRAYHSGFNCGFNCAEAVNLAPVDWLPHGQMAVEQYRGQGRKTSVSHDKLLLGAAREAVRAHWELNLLKKNTTNNLRWKNVCGKEGTLAKAFKARVDTERVRREFLCNSLRAVKMENNFDTETERECTICLFDLHLSAVGCPCSPNKFACLNHSKQLCSCPWNFKYFLFRYDLNELGILVDALEGKLSAIYRWARLDLGLALSSFVSKEHQQTSGSGKVSNSNDSGSLKDGNAQSSLSYMKDLFVKNLSKKTVKESSSSNSAGVEIVQKNNLCSIGVSSSAHPSNLPDVNLPSEDLSCNPKTAAVKSEAKKPTVSSQDNVICLSDDEGPEQVNPRPTKLMEENSGKSDISKEGVAIPADNAKIYHSPEKESSSTSVTSTPPRRQTESQLLPNVENSDVWPSTDDSVNMQTAKGGSLTFSSEHGSCSVRISPSESRCKENSLVTKESDIVDKVSTNATTGLVIESSSACGHEKHEDERQERIGNISTGNAVDSVETMTSSSCLTQNMDKLYRQKGPRIAKVVRRINCNVELLELGEVLPGKLWSNSHAIFPRGFRSRVKYMNVLEPERTCLYISEIADGGRHGPLFVVSLEHFPSEVFVHTSATKCWDLVRERANLEITKQHRMGKMNLPPIQPPGSLDGFEMFGFSTPSIVQAIEATDKNRICAGYWECRPFSRLPSQTQQHPQPIEQPGKAGLANVVAPGELDALIKGLLVKADTAELQALQRLLKINISTVDQHQHSLLTLLDGEISRRCTPG